MRFGVPFDPPRSTSYAESWHLMQALLDDPSSRVGAAVAGWDYPVSREWLITADLYDAFIAVNTKKGRKPKSCPRPWGDKDRKRFGRATRPQDEIRAALAARGHG